MMVSPRLAGYLFAAAGAALFSTKAIFIKLAYREEVNAPLMLAYRMAFALPFFVAVGVWAVKKKRERQETLPAPRTIAQAMGAGFVGYYLASYFDFAGLQYISAQLERLVLFTYPLFVMFIGVLVMGERLSRHGVAAAATTYTGLAIAFLTDLPHGGEATVLGTGLVLLAALCFAIHQVFAKRFIGTLGSVLYTAISMSAAAVMCILHQAAVSGGNFAATPRFIWLSAGCAIIATVLPALCTNAGLARVSPSAVAMIATVSPIVTIALAVAILGETFTFADAIGSLLVLTGVGLYTWGDNKQARIGAAA